MMVCAAILTQLTTVQMKSRQNRTKQTELQQHIPCFATASCDKKTGRRFHDEKVRIFLMNSKLSKIADNRYASNGGESILLLG